MTGLKFNGGQTERLYSPYLNNLANVSKNSVISNLDFSSTGLNVTIASGRIFFSSTNIDVLEQTVTVNTNNSSNPRHDLIVVNESGIVSIIQGTPGPLSIPGDYNSDEHIALYSIILQPSISSLSIDNNVKDLRVFNTGGGTSGGSFLKDVHPFSNQTSITVTHNLGDNNPIVQVFNNQNEKIEPQLITIINRNQITVTFSTSTSGYITTYGGSGLNNAYYKVAFTSQTTLSINHQLNNRYVLVQVVDSSGNEIQPTSITRTNENTVDIVFGSSQSGTVIVAGGISLNPFEITGVSTKRIVVNDTEPLNPEEGDIWIKPIL